MLSFIKAFATFAIFGSLLFTSSNAESEDEEDKLSMYPNGLPCTPCPITSSSDIALAKTIGMEDCTVYVKVNFFASETGTYINKIVAIRLLLM
jgi:hypothetical protein